MVASSSRGIGGHHNPVAQTSDWITPPHVLRALGEFDLDPCQSMTQPWPCAKQGFTETEDGLKQDWFGDVYINPPYDKKLMPAFLERMKAYRRGVGLIFGRTETQNFVDYIWQTADALLFLAGRLHFYYPDVQLETGTIADICQGSHQWAARPDNEKVFWCPNCGMAKGNSGGPSVFIAYGANNVERLRNCGMPGALVTKWECINME